MWLKVGAFQIPRGLGTLQEDYWYNNKLVNTKCMKSATAAGDGAAVRPLAQTAALAPADPDFTTWQRAWCTT